MQAPNSDTCRTLFPSPIRIRTTMARSRVTNALAVICGLVVLYFFSVALRPLVIYVDTVSNLIVPDFVPGSNSNHAAVKDVSEDSPIKDTAHEEQLAQKQVGDLQLAGVVLNVETESQPVYDKSKKVKGTFVTLARNQELYELIKAVRGVEDRFNRKFNYDWVFLNDEEFTQEFKDLTSSIVSGKTKYGKIPKEHWSYPDWVDLEKAAKSRAEMKAANIIYGDMESYRHVPVRIWILLAKRAPRRVRLVLESRAWYPDSL